VASQESPVMHPFSHCTAIDSIHNTRCSLPLAEMIKNRSAQDVAKYNNVFFCSWRQISTAAWKNSANEISVFLRLLTSAGGQNWRQQLLVIYLQVNQKRVGQRIR
jgi:hypothetical protein